jgi:23S rRNA pseudouridine1911/1915/1917 synthase
MGAESSGGRSGPSTGDPVVLYEDNHLIAVFKPAGLLVQGDASGRPTLMDQVKDWLVRTYDKPGAAFLGLLHRLDRPVAGVILFAKTSKGASRLSRQIRERTVEKTYRALVEGELRAEAGELRHWLGEEAPIAVADAPAPGLKEARLRYRVVERRAGRTLVEIDLETGRKHQIRAQLAHGGHPIVGDRVYGARTPFGPDAIALVATRLRFRAATPPDREITVELPAALDPLR